VKDFLVNGTPILKLPLEAEASGHDEDDLQQCEFCVGVDWQKTYPLKEAKTFTGVFANQNIVCKLRDQKTIDFLKRSFPLGDAEE